MNAPKRPRARKSAKLAPKPARPRKAAPKPSHTQVPSQVYTPTDCWCLQLRMSPTEWFMKYGHEHYDNYWYGEIEWRLGNEYSDLASELASRRAAYANRRRADAARRRGKPTRDTLMEMYRGLVADGVPKRKRVGRLYNMLGRLSLFTDPTRHSKSASVNVLH